MSFFSSLFSKNKVENLVKYDMHSHIIPAIDDGVRSVEEAVEVILGLKDMGFTGAYTTPHIMSDFYKNNPDIIKKGLGDVEAALAEKGISFTLKVAAEYYIDEGFVDLLKQKEPLWTIADKYVLVECSYLNKPRNLNSVFFQLQSEGYTPILAHPERYPFFYPNPQELLRLHDTGILFQINLLSLIGYYSTSAQKVAEFLIKHNAVDMIGTDCHSPKQLEKLKQSLQSKGFAKLEQSKLLNNSLI